MQNKVIILLHTNNTTADWVITDHTGQVLSTVTNGELSQLIPCEDHEIIAIIPGTEVLLTTVKLPKLRRSRLQQALPYALEEQLLDEPESLHFAPGPYQADQSQSVAVIKKTALEHWLTLLQQLNLRPDILIPASFSLPFEENQWAIAVIHNGICVRTGAYTGFSCEPENLETLLSLQLSEEKQLPHSIKIWGDIAVPLHELRDARNDKGPTIIQEHTSPILAINLRHHPFINLLQSSYSPPLKLQLAPKNKKAWQFSGIALLIWLGLVIITPLGSAILLSYEHHHLQNKLAGIYKKYHLNIADPDAKAPLEATLRKTLKENETTLFFQWLAALVKTGDSVRIENLTFENQRMNLELTTPSFSSLDEFIFSLRSEGLQITQQTAVLSGTQVKANLLIERNHS